MSHPDNKRITEKLHWYVGTIISGTTIIEGALGWRIRIYFFPKSNKQATIFHQNILNAPYLNFDRKIALFQQIPYFKKLKNYQKIVDSLRVIQKIRNAVAHFELAEALGGTQEIVIYNPNTFKKTKLNDKLIEEFIKQDKFLLKSLAWKYTLASKYGITNKDVPNGHDVEIRAMGRHLSKLYRNQ